jgi:hypothetical protein
MTSLVTSVFLGSRSGSRTCMQKLLPWPILCCVWWQQWHCHARTAALAESRRLSIIDDKPGIEPVIPFCRKGHSMSTMAATATDNDDSDRVVQRILMFGGKGRDYVHARHGSTILGDLWVLHIENAAFKWSALVPATDKPEARCTYCSPAHNGTDVGTVYEQGRQQ